MMGQGGGNGQVMDHRHHPGPCSRHLVGNADHGSLVGQVQVGCGFVQKQPVSPTQGLPRPELGQGPGQLDPLLPAPKRTSIF